MVLEAGAGDFSLAWALVQPQVAGMARVCTCDRAGFGWSDVSPKPRSAQKIVADLHSLLARCGMRGPYVLVGHSLGGMMVRLYEFKVKAGESG